MFLFTNTYVFLYLKHVQLHIWPNKAETGVSGFDWATRAEEVESISFYY